MHASVRILIASFGLAIAVAFIWGTTSYFITTTVRNDSRLIHTRGWIAIAVTFFAAVAGLVNGAILGALTPKGRLPRRLLWHLGGYFSLAAGWGFYHAKANAIYDLKDVVGAGDYALFERQIDGRLNEAWGAALIHADPKAMELCIRHGAGKETWARTDTSLFASQPNQPAIEVIALHRYWHSSDENQLRMAKESLRLLYDNGADLNSACLDGGRLTPMQYAFDFQISALAEALQEFGVPPIISR